jgi:hypothetical protein
MTAGIDHSDADAKAKSFHMQECRCGNLLPDAPGQSSCWMPDSELALLLAVRGLP